jgi:hypothetical protein
MSRLNILTEEEQRRFDYPPQLSDEDRSLCFMLNDTLQRKINQLRTATNKVGFFLQYGYFKSCQRFFPSSRYHQADIVFVAKLLGIPLTDIHLNKYVYTTPEYHQKTILSLLGYHPFEVAKLNWFLFEMENRVEQFSTPRELFFELLSLLYSRNAEIPSYHRLSDLITQCYLSFENKLLHLIETTITPNNRTLLDSLLSTKRDGSNIKLSQLKSINQSTKPKAIQASINIFLKIQTIFKSLLPLIEALNLSSQACHYYAIWVKKARLIQITQFPDHNRRYLYLIAFIQHQYYLRQDTFVDIFLKCVQSAKNTCDRRVNESERLTRNEKRAAVKHMSTSYKSYRELVDEIDETTRLPILTKSGKLQRIAELIAIHKKQMHPSEADKIKQFELSIDRIEKNKDYFDTLEKLSIRLQNRVAKLLNVIIFNDRNSIGSIFNAITHYAKTEGRINAYAPIDFITSEEISHVNTDEQSFRISLYKILLFKHMADAIKSGGLNLKYSYRYLSIKEYLIDQNNWDKNRTKLLKLTGLYKFNNVSHVLAQLKKRLDKKYDRVNQRFLSGKNTFLSINDEGIPHVSTQTLEEKETRYISKLLSQQGYVPVLRVLSEIDHITKFSQYFKHHNLKNLKIRPKLPVFHAGVLALGCNIGVPQMAQMSTGINENTLTNTVNWYFDQESMQYANQCIVDLIQRLSLSSVFVSQKNKVHSASDGSKFNVAVESLLASYSFKYFGKDKGISIYTFIDERQSLFHSLVMSASEREAAYVIDGLNKISSPHVSIHSTDTHGYTESVFGITHLLGFAFAPRLKQIGKQKRYSFSNKNGMVQID